MRIKKMANTSSTWWGRKVWGAYRGNRKQPRVHVSNQTGCQHFGSYCRNAVSSVRPLFLLYPFEFKLIPSTIAFRVATLRSGPRGCGSLAFHDRIFSRVSGSLRATSPPQTRAAKASKMGMIFVMPMKAAKMKLAMMAANLQMPLRMPNAVPL